LDKIKNATKKYINPPKNAKTANFGKIGQNGGIFVFFGGVFNMTPNYLLLIFNLKTKRPIAKS